MKPLAYLCALASGGFLIALDGRVPMLIPIGLAFLGGFLLGKGERAPVPRNDEGPDYLVEDEDAEENAL